MRPNEAGNRLIFIADMKAIERLPSRLNDFKLYCGHESN